MRIFSWVVLGFVFSAMSANAGPEDAFLKTAEIIYSQANASEGELRKSSLRKVREILDSIVANYPESDLAVRILLKENVNGIDIAALDAELDAPSSPPSEELVPSAEVAPGSTSSVVDPLRNAAPTQTVRAESFTAPQESLPVATEQTENALGLDSQAVRDIQARLLVLGHDPNGIDGKIGQGTRGAVRSWQSSVSVSPTGYLNTAQLSALKDASEEELAIWLRAEENAKLYEPPPPIALTPSVVSGRWNYTTTCGPRSKVGRARIRGVLSVRHAGSNRYVGNLVNSEGLRARFDGRLNGRNVSSTANFGFLFGKVQLRARVDDHQLVMRGRDSNGCAFYAAK